MAVDTLLSSVSKVQTNPILLLQEPYLSKGEIRFKVPKYNIYSFDSQCRSAVAIPEFFRSWYEPSLSDRDTTTVVLEDDSKDKYLVVSSYFDINLDGVVPAMIEKVKQYSVTKNIPIVVGIDSNAHSTLWGCTANNKRGDILEEWLLPSNLSLVNQGNELTFVSAIGSSIIDLTLCSLQLINKINDWFVEPEYQFSDHRKIVFTLDFDYTLEIWSRSLRKADWKFFRSILHKSLPRLQEPIFWERQTLDKKVDELVCKIQQALDRACPLRKIKVKGPTIQWWSADLEHLQRTVRRAHRTFCKSRTDENHVNFKILRKKYQKAVKVAKQEAWEYFCTSITDVKSLSKLSKSLTNPKKGQLGMLETEHGTTQNGAEVLQVLMDVHFPGSLDEAPEGMESGRNGKGSISNNFMKNANYLSFITKDKVKAALKSFGSWKAAGPDGFKPIILQNLDDSTIDHLVQIYKAAVALGYNPKAWRKSKVIFIPKAGKVRCDTAKSLRPISLTDFLYKALERVVQWKLTESFKIPDRLHHFQFAFAKDKSTDGALSQVIDKIEASLLRNQHCLGIFMDISGAFDSIKTSSILDGMKNKGMPTFLINWFENCLTTRMASTSLNSDTITRYLTQGVAQGGVGSPLAWNLAIDDILQDFNKPPTSLVGFADDLSATISGSDPNILVDLIQPVIDKIIKRGAEKGLSFNSKKTQVVDFTLKKVKATKKVQINGAPIEYSKRATYLGMILDEKLSFGPHINNKINKCKQHLYALQRVIGQKYGPNPHLMRWAYTGIVRPKLTYGCHLWSHKLTKTLKEKIKRLDRLCCLSIAPIKSSSPTMGLGVIYNLLPLDLFIRKTAAMTYLRIHNQTKPFWDGIGKQKGKLGHLKTCSKFLEKLGLMGIPQDKITMSHCWQKNFKILDFEDFKNDSTESKPNMIYCYTDGSKVGQNAGFGFHIRRQNQPNIDCSEYLGNFATVFQAEVIAITRVAAHLMKQFDSKILIRSDSQAALLAIGSNIVSSRVVLECIQTLNKLGKQGNSITLQYIKAHVGHDGNEAADLNAKRGAESLGSGPEPFLPVPQSYFKSTLKAALNSEWQARWDQNPEFCKQTKLWFKKITPMMLVFLKKGSRQELGKIIQFITGHCNLMKHQFRIGKSSESNCRLCNTTWETPWHLTTECPKLQSIREKYFHGPILHTFVWSPQILLRFCKESSIWSLLDGQK